MQNKIAAIAKRKPESSSLGRSAYVWRDLLSAAQEARARPT